MSRRSVRQGPDNQSLLLVCAVFIAGAVLGNNRSLTVFVVSLSLDFDPRCQWCYTF
jgi:hypothetical protein